MKRAAAIELQTSNTPTSLALLQRAGLKVEEADGNSYRVADRFLFFPAVGFWREIEGAEQGYGPRALIAYVRIGSILHPETPAGRDSEQTGSVLTDEARADAESAGVTATLLPMVTP